MQFPILPQSTVDIAVCKEALAFLRLDIFPAELPEGQAFRTRRGDSIALVTPSDALKTVTKVASFYLIALKNCVRRVPPQYER